MPRQVIARCLLVCAVLLAQQTALAHDLWHATGHAGASQSKSPDGKKLCDLHDLLGNVLGAVSAPELPVALLALSDADFLPAVERTAPGSPIAAQSRGPPRIS